MLKKIALVPLAPIAAVLACAAKLMGIFFGMDRMIGKDSETGLANLATAAAK